jgi:hypothetical protein
MKAMARNKIINGIREGEDGERQNQNDADQSLHEYSVD